MREKVEAAVAAARRKMDADELAKVPRAKLDPLFLDFGRISCNVERDVILTNTGQVSFAQTGSECPSFQCPTECITLTLTSFACLCEWILWPC